MFLLYLICSVFYSWRSDKFYQRSLFIHIFLYFSLFIHILLYSIAQFHSAEVIFHVRLLYFLNWIIFAILWSFSLGGGEQSFKWTIRLNLVGLCWWPWHPCPSTNCAVVALSGVFLPSIGIAGIYQICLEEIFPLQFLE